VGGGVPTVLHSYKPQFMITEHKVSRHIALLTVTNVITNSTGWHQLTLCCWHSELIKWVYWLDAVHDVISYTIHIAPGFISWQSVD